ncbi:hypothetical protein BD410DRAFT_902589 [Rickenella mellea]|uniref:F-box domain-containing protein n=1 Tax=Rickenella mellea TaxID=50990 RepID=A0A4Y7PJ01_9AGAM|nr:hypothetical protein BD410DRAFT_902589 [Rickenella mellea]
MLRFENSEAGRLRFRWFLRSLSRSYSNLQTLHVHHANYRSLSPDWGRPLRQPCYLELILDSHSAPHLRSLCLDAPEARIVTSNNFPFVYLREINLKSSAIGIAEFLTLLGLSPAVEVVAACILHTPDGSDHGNAVLTLANLKHLDISYECDQEGQISCPLEELDLPALEWLYFNVVDNHWRWGPPSPPTHGPQMRSLIYRSRPPLKVLRIHGFSIPAADVMHCIPFLPDLSCLDIEHVGNGDDWNGIVHVLTRPIPPSDANLPGYMCPQLNEIIFGQEKHADPDLVVKMILSRMPAGSYKPFRVTVLSCWERDMLAHPKIQDCIENGLKFEGRVDRVDKWGKSE